jgi:hypothetical protein
VCVSDGAILRIETGRELGLLDPSTGLEGAVAFGVEGRPGGDAAEEGADVDEVNGGGVKGPVRLVGVVDFKTAVRWRPLC